jgi:hippurate hydrolase
VVLSSCDTLRVTVRGASGHSGTPHQARDPIPAACEMVTALQVLVTRAFDTFDPVVVTVGSFHAGTADNMIPAEARFGATLRSFSPASRDRLEQKAVRLVREIAAAHELEVDVEYAREFPLTVNHPDEAAFVGAVAREAFGPTRFLEAPRPFTVSEDFAYVLNEVPGAFVALGACPPDRNPATAASNHSAEAEFDEGVLAQGARLYAELALRRLAIG